MNLEKVCLYFQEEKQIKEEEEPKQEEEVDIDLEDPEVQDAALKIQAGFKGMKARQEVKSLKVWLNVFVCSFVWFDSLHPINNLSVKQGPVFLGWTSTKLG